jgi:multicomponent K+:H+ antiporter subunit A
VLSTLNLMARRAMRFINTQRLQPQLFLLIGATVIAAWAALGETEVVWGQRPPLPVSPIFASLWLVGMAGAVGAAWQAKFHRLAALMMMAMAGLTTCLTFVWFSAPDLALTQLSVEVVTTVLFLLGLRWLPKRVPFDIPFTARTVGRRSRDLLLAVLAGAGMASIAYAILTRPFPQSISPYFLTRTLPEGGGTNVVNVILVDFRGFDTMGEITVLGAVALTVYSLLRRFRPPRETIASPSQQVALPPDLVTDLVNPRTAAEPAQGFMLVPAVMARLLMPIAILVAIYLFMRGHNESGGGFVAGLVASVAIILQYMVSGTQWVEAHMHLRRTRWIAMGLLFAVTTGLGSLLFGYPFLTTHTAHVYVPVIGDIHIPSATFFDIGVFTVVVGATLLILTALAHQSVRSHRESHHLEMATWKS